MSDYPKVIHVGGIHVTVTSAEDEARWTQPAAVTTTQPDEPPDVNPLDSVELDGAALNDGHEPEPEPASEPEPEGQLEKPKKASKKK